ncbi:hypothetical protein BaRGS_00032693, partial [Batillaria attramentaria]
ATGRPWIPSKQNNWPTCSIDGMDLEVMLLPFYRLGAKAAHTINALSGMTKKRVEMSGCSGDNSGIDRAILSLQHFTESDLPATAKHVENNVERGQLPAHILNGIGLTCLEKRRGDAQISLSLTLKIRQ